LVELPVRQVALRPLQGTPASVAGQAGLHSLEGDERRSCQRGQTDQDDDKAPPTPREAATPPISELAR
jgi:hypothetical protein